MISGTVLDILRIQNSYENPSRVKDLRIPAHWIKYHILKTQYSLVDLCPFVTNCNFNGSLQIRKLHLKY